MRATGATAVFPLSLRRASPNGTSPCRPSRQRNGGKPARSSSPWPGGAKQISEMQASPRAPRLVRDAMVFARKGPADIMGGPPNRSTPAADFPLRSSNPGSHGIRGSIAPSGANHVSMLGPGAALADSFAPGYSPSLLSGRPRKKRSHPARGRGTGIHHRTHEFLRAVSQEGEVTPQACPHSEQARRPGRVAVPETARQEAMLTIRCGKSIRRKVHWMRSKRLVV